jgi:predicted RNA binding protein YcfA (HicA-like mRNA interferase family)
MISREVARKLRRVECQELSRRSGGSHRKWYNPATGKGTSIPDWGAKDLKIGTLRAAVAQLGIAWKDFEGA